MLGLRGYLTAWLSLVWVANAYMSLFGRLRFDTKHEHIEIAASQTERRLNETGRTDTSPVRIAGQASGKRSRVNTHVRMLSSGNQRIPPMMRRG